MNTWGGFRDEDIVGNDLYIFDDSEELNAKPGVAPDAYRIFGAIRDAQFLDAYFAPFTRGAGDVGSSEEFIFHSESQRLAKELEVTHLAYISALDWNQSQKPVKEPLMNEIFLGYFANLVGGTVRSKRQSTNQPKLVCIHDNKWKEVHWDRGQYTIGAAVPQLHEYDTEGSEAVELLNEELEEPEITPVEEKRQYSPSELSLHSKDCPPTPYHQEPESLAFHKLCPPKPPQLWPLPRSHPPPLKAHHNTFKTSSDKSSKDRDHQEDQEDQEGQEDQTQTHPKYRWQQLPM
ncbi:hypothetical protein BJV74DRAFT_884272 [Russula compacta]|nr:hypothetical protein BJV74DRAFT_884272 [Russula compacta]